MDGKARAPRGNDQGVSKLRRAVAANAAERRFHDWLRNTGCAICGSPTAIHHAVGSAAKHNKIHIGQWWVVPLCYEHHQGPGGIHGDLSLFDVFDRTALGHTRKEIEKSLFARFAAIYEERTGEQIPKEVKEAIAGYHK